MRPSFLTKQFPMDSITQKTETEVIAMNVAKILSHRGDVFRRLVWEEYVEVREEDGATNWDLSIERKYFDVAAPYLETAMDAASFSSLWRDILKGEQVV